MANTNGVNHTGVNQPAFHRSLLGKNQQRSEKHQGELNRIRAILFINKCWFVLRFFSDEVISFKRTAQEFKKTKLPEKYLSVKVSSIKSVTQLDYAEL